MSSLLGRAATRLTFTACTLIVLAAVGQPIASPTLAHAHVIAKIDSLPFAAKFLKVAGDETTDNAACAVEPILEPIKAEAMNEAAAAALARSALRMRWLLTSPSASNRGCVANGCTG